jgi:hypothetical protein
MDLFLDFENEFDIMDSFQKNKNEFDEMDSFFDDA